MQPPQRSLSVGAVSRSQLGRENCELHALESPPCTEAKKWVERGIKTIDEVWKIQHELTSHQMLGLRHIDDFELKIPRAEMVEMEDRVIRSVKAIDPHLQVRGSGPSLPTV